MKRKTRTDLHLYQLEPKSVSKVFALIDNFIERSNITKRALDSFLDEYPLTLEEKYHFLYFLVKYIDPTNKNNPLVKEYDHYTRLGEITEAYNDWYNTTIKDCQKLISILSAGDLGTFSKYLIKQKKEENSLESRIEDLIPESPYSDSETREQVGFFKLSLVFRTKQLKGFKNHVHRLFKQYYSTDEIDAMFNNSFKTGIETIPNKYLGLNVVDSAWLFTQFHKLYKEYNSEIIIYYEFEVKEREEQIKKLPSNRRKYAPKIPPKKSFNKGTRLDFAKLLFINFKDIRVTYYKKKSKHPEYTLSKYLLNVSKNIVERK